MNNIIERLWNKNRMVQIEDLKGSLFQDEAAGHTFKIYGIDDAGNTVALSGTPSGVFHRPDNTDVVLSCSVSGGVVSATLPSTCYDVPGRGGITVFLTSDSQKTAIYAAIATVTRTESGTVAPPATQDVVDLINAISAAVATIPASYSSLMADIAPTYSSSSLYAVGQYAWYDGDLKRCIVPITTAESYTAAHWTSAVLGNDVSDLKSALNIEENFFKLKDISLSFEQGGVATSGGGTGITPTESATRVRTDIIPVPAMTGITLNLPSTMKSNIFLYNAQKQYKSMTNYKTGVNTVNTEEASYFRVVIGFANDSSITPSDVSSVVANWENKYLFAFRGYINSLGYTALTKCLESGWYACGSGYISSITDLPSDYPASTSLNLVVYKRTAGSASVYIRQELSTATGKVWFRICNASGVVTTDWVNLSDDFMMHRGYLNTLGYTSLLQAKMPGWYSCGGSYISSITDLPDGFPAGKALHLVVYKLTSAPSDIFIRQEVSSAEGYLWYRTITQSGSVISGWKVVGKYLSTVRACIIGASIEAGTTHETASSGASVDPSKAYLTVALQNNGITVTNMSHGGMGFIRPSPDTTLFKELVDNTDFSAFESVYITIGSNDWNYNQPLGSVTDTGTDTVCGMMKYAIEKILTSNPYIKIFMKTPDLRATRGSVSTLWGWNAQNEAAIPYTLKDLNDAMISICSTYSIDVIESRQHSIVNAYNIMTVFPDGIHPSKKTMALMAQAMTGRITMK